jgi:hypothetical protein
VVRGFHLILSNYGFWLPNDPRGSWSDFVRKWELVRFGKATKVETHRSVAAAKHDRGLRLKAKGAMVHPEVRLNGRQGLAVGHGFARAATEGKYLVHACAILPEHSHLVMAAMERSISLVAGHLKGRATQALLGEGAWEGGRPVWGRKMWKVFLFSDGDMRRAIEYVEGNPGKEGKRRQRWSFVVPYGS